MLNTTKLFQSWIAVLSAISGLFIYTPSAHALSKQKHGYYEGQLKVFRSFPESATQQGPLGFKGSALVGVQVKRSGGLFHAWTGTIELINANTGIPVMDQIRFSKEFSFRGTSLWKMNLKINSLLNKNGKESVFEFREKGGCLDGVSSADDYVATLCMRKNNTFTFSVRSKNDTNSVSDPVLELVANPMSKPSLPQARPLSLKEAIQIALKTSPASKVEMLQRLAAKTQLQLAWLSLLPRINGPLLANLWWPLPTTPQTWVQNIGSIAPFLSINAWSALDEARKNSQIVNTGYTIFRANLVNLVEQAVYTYRRDVLLTAEYNDLLTTIQNALDQTKKIQDLQPAGSYISAQDSEDLTQALKSAQDIVKDQSISNSLADDKHAIAQVLGIKDLEIVRDIKIGPEDVPLNQDTQKVDINPMADDANYISLKYLELLQVDQVIADLRGLRTKHPFLLFDFAGNPSDGIGFNLISEFALDKISVETAQANKQVTDSWVRFATINSAENYNDAIDGYKNALQARDRLKTRLDQLLQPIQKFDFAHPSKISLNKGDDETIETVVKDYLLFINQTRNYLAAFRLARATLDRARLVYHYEQVKLEADPYSPTTHLPEPNDRDNSNSRLPKPVVPEDDSVVDNNQIDNEKDTGVSYRIALPVPQPIIELQQSN